MNAQLTSQPEGAAEFQPRPPGPSIDDIIDRMESAADFEDAAVIRNWIVPELLAYGEITAIYGAPGSLKSVLAATLAFQVATGTDFIGPTDQPPRRVLYIAAERGRSIKGRIRALAIHAGLPRPENLVVYDGPLDLCDPGRLRLVAMAAERKLGDELDLVIIDTIGAAMSRPTSDTGATLTAGHEIKSLAQTWPEPAVLYLHHTPVSREDRMAGGHFAQDADIIARARKTGADIGALDVVKNNESDPADWMRHKYRAISVTVPTSVGDFSEPVLVPLSSEEAAEPAPRLSGRTADAIEALASVSADAPAHLDDWRAAFYRTMADAKPEAQRKAFNRAKSDLLAAELIFESDPDHFSVRDIGGTEGDDFDA